MSKIAVCVSGDFRDDATKTSVLRQLRHLCGFISGCDCDIYIHSWNSESNELIRTYINANKIVFEEHKDFSDIANKIVFEEKNLKPNRDNGSISMFYSMYASYSLIENPSIYDYIVRFRPDIFCERSLFEILNDLRNEQKENTLYIPDRFLSQGITDQFAIGSPKVMAVYFNSYNYIKENISNIFFNPESVLLENLLQNQIKIKLLSFPFVLMRHEIYTIDSLSYLLQSQERFWWAKKNNLPVLTDLTEFFTDKHKANISFAKELLPEKFFFRKDGYAVQIEYLDKNPNVFVNFYKIKKRKFIICNYFIKDNTFSYCDRKNDYFVFPYIDTSIVIAFYRFENNKILKEKITLCKEDIQNGSFYLKAILSGYKDMSKIPKKSKIKIIVKELYFKHKSNFMVRIVRRIYKRITGR